MIGTAACMNYTILLTADASVEERRLAILGDGPSAGAIDGAPDGSLNLTRAVRIDLAARAVSTEGGVRKRS